jgi:hypothetical protein
MTSTLVHMRRAGLSWVALAAILVVALAPRLSGDAGPLGTGGDPLDTMSRSVAPAFDEATLRQDDPARSMREPTLVLWLLLLASVVAIGIQQRRIGFTDAPNQNYLIASVAARGCRAPPTASV